MGTMLRFSPSSAVKTHTANDRLKASEKTSYNSGDAVTVRTVQHNVETKLKKAIYRIPLRNALSVRKFSFS